MKLKIQDSMTTLHTVNQYSIKMKMPTSGSRFLLSPNYYKTSGFLSLSIWYTSYLLLTNRLKCLPRRRWWCKDGLCQQFASNNNEISSLALDQRSAPDIDETKPGHGIILITYYKQIVRECDSFCSLDFIYIQLRRVKFSSSPQAYSSDNQFISFNIFISS